MVYIDENSSKLQIPTLNTESPTSIKIKDILRNNTINIDINNSVISKYFCEIDITDWTFKFINGSQYEYYLINNNHTIASGILQCGDFNTNSNIQYDTEDKNYKQYNR